MTESAQEVLSKILGGSNDVSTSSSENPIATLAAQQPGSPSVAPSAAAKAGLRWFQRRGEVLDLLQRARKLTDASEIQFLSAEESANYQRVQNKVAGLIALLQQ